ncbi:MAG TPA: F0F1 ATP synthase subunit A [Bryobacteraceae bacterium]|nr:F0F1 ATP synthase subunit A [Bryobacteraceae bacterium]
MPEHELWLTALFNDHLAGLATAILNVVGMTAENAARPWQNWIVMELLVVAILVLLAAVLRPALSVENPGRLQHFFEIIYTFWTKTTADFGIHDGAKYVPFFGTLFLFVLSMNLIGIIPVFESPTMTPAVPAGLAVCTFIYYNLMGVRENGVLKYIAHFAGPVRFGNVFATAAIMLLMFPLEIISNLARLLSLTIRLWGNMFAGEQVTNVFISLTYLVIPVIFMGLHVFVSLVQAYVFALLTVIYVSAVNTHGDAH